MRRLALILAATCAAIALPAPARAAESIAFLDMRPAAIDLATARLGERWQVPVLDGLPGRGHRLTLTVAFRPAGVLRVERPLLSLDEGEVGTFVLALRRARAGSGEHRQRHRAGRRGQGSLRPGRSAPASTARC
ncbi:hypothetical protein AB0F81_48100 [Actinoplanes sp. NPDC024001]|uniref:hypothetical protein n=1 Tax=Actinoplanes sp. NPDC024001 TaxID=3154598 RepID=UPI0033E27C7A